jgi:hypothetical protein
MSGYRLSLWRSQVETDGHRPAVFGERVSDTVLLCQFGNVFRTEMDILSALG